MQKYVGFCTVASFRSVGTVLYRIGLTTKRQEGLTSGARLVLYLLRSRDNILCSYPQPTNPDIESVNRSGEDRSSFLGGFVCLFVPFFILCFQIPNYGVHIYICYYPRKVV